MDSIRAAGVELPVVAIGGIKKEDIKPLKEAGVNGVAVSGSIIGAQNPVEYTAQLLQLLQK